MPNFWATDRSNFWACFASRAVIDTDPSSSAFIDVAGTNIGIPPGSRSNWTPSAFTFLIVGGLRPSPFLKLPRFLSGSNNTENSLSGPLPKSPLHRSQSAFFVVSRPPRALRRMCSGFSSPRNEVGHMIHCFSGNLLNQVTGGHRPTYSTKSREEAFSAYWNDQVRRVLISS